MSAPLLAMTNMSVALHSATRSVDILSGITLTLDRGERLGIVGPSGSGKSMTALAVMGLLPETMRASGTLCFEGENLIPLPEAKLCRLRGRRMAMIFQEPMTALNPAKSIGAQIAEGRRLHLGESRSDAEREARRLMDRVGLPAPRFDLDLYPHQLSGGQRQRVMIAMAIACAPDLLIADEPTTALDVTVQAQILTLLDELIDETGMAMMLISHDLGVVSRMTQRIAVMEQGRIVKAGATKAVMRELSKPQTDGLSPSGHFATKPILQVKNLVRDYPLPRTSLFARQQKIRALHGINLEIAQGESLGIVGESGSGKSTLARAIMGLEKPQAGQVLIAGQDIHALSRQGLRQARQGFQAIFQDPYGSLDPRHKVGRILAEPVASLQPQTSAAERVARIEDVLEAVGLPKEAAQKYPHEFSGGQRQRIAIARALITRPALIIADEPVSALDASIQAQVLALMLDLRKKFGLSYLFISHDLGVVRAVTDHVAVLYQGRIVEQGPTAQVFDHPQHAYTKTLINAVLKPV
ncbi:ABC transporter ATP-binding protein [Brucellaceae bacterium D45D]